MHFWLASELCMILNMQNEPWPQRLAALRTPLYSLSLSNKVLTWGQQSFELRPCKRHLGWWRLWSWLDKDNETRALLQDSPLCPALTLRRRRQMKGTAGGTALESHLSSQELWEITRAQANSALLRGKHLPYYLKPPSCLPPLLT